VGGTGCLGLPDPAVRVFAGGDIGADAAPDHPADEMTADQRPPGWSDPVARDATEPGAPGSGVLSLRGTTLTMLPPPVASPPDDPQQRHRNLVIVAAILLVLGVATAVEVGLRLPDIPVASNVVVIALFNLNLIVFLLLLILLFRNLAKLWFERRHKVLGSRF